MAGSSRSQPFAARSSQDISFETAHPCREPAEQGCQPVGARYPGILAGVSASSANSHRESQVLHRAERIKIRPVIAEINWNVMPSPGLAQKSGYRCSLIPGTDRSRFEDPFAAHQCHLLACEPWGQRAKGQPAQPGTIGRLHQSVMQRNGSSLILYERASDSLGGAI